MYLLSQLKWLGDSLVFFSVMLILFLWNSVRNSMTCILPPFPNSVERHQFAG